MSEIIVSFTAFNRPDYLKEALKSWLRVDSIEKCYFIFNVDTCDKTNDVIAEIESFSEEAQKRGAQGFDIAINKDGYQIKDRFISRHSDPRIGCQLNSWLAFERGFAKGNAVLIAEDDIVVAKDLINMQLWANKNLAPNNKVMFSCGTATGTSAKTIEQARGLGAHLYTDSRFFTLGSMTWKDRWEKYLRDDWDFNYSTGTSFEEPGGWDCHISHRVLKKHRMLCTFPYRARTYHIGIHGVNSRHGAVYNNTISQTFDINSDYKNFLIEW